MSVKDKTGLKTDNNQLYDDAISLTVEVNATNQKSVTNDQLDSFATLKDRITSVDVSVAPTAIILDFSNNEQFILDLTAEPATKIFDVTSILGIVSGQNNRIEVIKNSDQSITLTPATGPVISEGVNKLQITGIGSPVTFAYSYLDGSVDGQASSIEVFVDATAGDDNKDGLSEANAVQTDPRAFTIAQDSGSINITINRKTDGAYFAGGQVLENVNLIYSTHGAGAAPVITIGGQIKISGVLKCFDVKLQTTQAGGFFKVIDNLNVILIETIVDINAGPLFVENSALGYSLSLDMTDVDLQGGPARSIVDSNGMRAIDVISKNTTISLFDDNTISTVLNIKGGLDPISDITFKGEVVPFGFSSIVKLVENGMDQDTWTVEDAGINVGDISSINFLDEASIGSSVADIWIDTPGAQMFVLGFGSVGIVQRFTITNGDSSTLVEDIGNFIDLTSFGITVGSSIHLSQAIDKLVVSDVGTNKIYSLNIVTPGDLTSIVGITSTFDPGVDAGAQDSLPLGIWLSDDGLNLAMTGLFNRNVYHFTLGGAFDVTGAGVSFLSKFFLGGIPTGVHLSFAGLTMYIWDYSLGRLREFDLGNQYTVNNAVETELVVITPGGTANENAGVHLNDVENKMYLINKAINAIQQYNFNGGRIYEVKKNGASFDPSNYSIRGSVENENDTEISTVAIIKNPTTAFVTVGNGSSIQKDFSIQIYKNV